MKHNIKIIYCPKCGWLLRAAWMAQELLTTFVDDLNAVSLCPSEIGGVYEIHLNDKLIFSRKQAEHFPEAKEIKQIIRDTIDPQRSLGHSDKK